MKININIGEILSKSWHIIWKFKVLWIFGILAGCAGGNGSRFNFSGNSNSFNSGNFNGGSQGNFNGGQMQPFFQQFQGMQPGQIFQDIMARYGVWIGLGILLLCVLWIVMYFLGIMGRTGLIRGASQADDGATSLKFGELWSGSTPYLWRVFLANLLVGLPIFLLVMILVVGMLLGVFATLSGNPQGARVVGLMFGFIGVFICLICVISIAAAIASWVLEQAQIAIVVEDLGVLAGFSRGWEVFKKSWLTIVVMAIILGFASGIAAFVAAIPLIGMIIVVAGMIGFSAAATAGFAFNARNMIAPLIIGACCFVVYLPVMLAVGGAINAYVQTAWTLIYRRLTAAPAPAAPAAPVDPAPALDVEALR